VREAYRLGYQTRRKSKTLGGFSIRQCTLTPVWVGFTVEEFIGTFKREKPRRKIDIVA
jgi:hypothetical protein